MANKTIGQLTSVSQVAPDAKYRADNSQVEDVSVSNTAMARTMLAEQRMQGANIELAEQITKDKEQLAQILKSKGSTISPLASYSEFSEKITALPVEDPYVKTSSAYLQKTNNLLPYTNALEKSHIIVIYCHNAPYAVGISKPNTLSLYKISKNADGLPKYTRVFNQSYPEMNILDCAIVATNLKNTYFSIGTRTIPVGQEKVPFYTTIFKLDLAKELITQVVLTEQQKTWLGAHCICSIDASFTMLSVGDYFTAAAFDVTYTGRSPFVSVARADGVIAINITNGTKYLDYAHDSMYCEEYWISASTLFIKDRNSVVRIARISGSSITITNTGLPQYVFLVDIPDKQEVLIYAFVPWSGDLVVELVVWTLNYFVGACVQVYRGWLSNWKQTKSNSLSYDYHGNWYTTLFTYGNKRLVVPNGCFTFGSFIFDIETTEVTFPCIDNPYNTTSLPLGAFSTGSTIYYIYRDEQSDFNTFLGSYVVNFPVTTSLTYRGKTYNIVKYTNPALSTSENI